MTAKMGARSGDKTRGEGRGSQVVLITGASSGIGEAAARSLSDAGFIVHAAARRADRLHALADEIGGVAHVLDVNDHAAVIDTIASIRPIDVLVNNAGVGRGWGSLATTDFAEIETTVTTNVLSAIHVIRAVLPDMIAQRNGHIVNVGSMAGLYPLPAALYGASKAAIHRLSTNLRLELVGTGVRVTEICPGRIETEFYDAAIDDADERARIKETGTVGVSAAECADVIRYAVTSPGHVNINRIELQPLEQTYGGSRFDPVERPGAGT